MTPVEDVLVSPTSPSLLAVAWVDDPAVMLGFAIVVVSLVVALVIGVERIRRAATSTLDPGGRKPPIENPPLEIVALDVEPHEPNRFDPRYRRFSGPFRDNDRRKISKTRFWGRQACPPLRGRVVLISLFVGADGHRWNEEEIARHLASLAKAARWMEQMAGRYGVEVGVGLSDVYFETQGESSSEVDLLIAESGGEVGLFEGGSIVRALTMMSRAAASLGFRDAVDFVDQVAARLPDVKTAWLLHIRLAGRSYAIPLDRTELEGVGLAFCHARQANFTEALIRPPLPRSAILVHEVLHLFGAQDKYGWPLSHFTPGTVTARDIMRLETERLAQLQVDPLTAREIGWLNEYPT